VKDLGKTSMGSPSIGNIDDFPHQHILRYVSEAVYGRDERKGRKGKGGGKIRETERERKRKRKGRVFI